MSETNAPKGDRLGKDYDKGPNPNPGGEIDTGDSVLPPYEDRSTETTNSRDMEAMAHSRDVTREQGAAPGRATSDRDTQSPADDLPPAGVGESSGRRGEDMVDGDGKEAGRQDEGTKGKSDRPEGSSDDRDRTGV
jgi:hypothetical protein